MNAEKLMTKNAVVFDENMTLQQAAMELIDRHLGGAPVVNSDGDVIGMITEKDLIVSADFIGESKMKIMKVHEVMTRDVVSFSKDSAVSEIASTLIHRNIKRVPILDQKKCAGIISRKDILKFLVSR